MKANEVPPEIRLAMLRQYINAFIDYRIAFYRMIEAMKILEPHLSVGLFPTFDEWVEYSFSKLLKLSPK
jgi:hypothetical protein